MNGKLHFNLVRNFGLCAGDIANLYLGSITDTEKVTPVLVKIARTEADNDLMQVEARNLAVLKAELANDKKASDSYFASVPGIADSFSLVVGNGKPRPQVNVLEFFPGFISVEDIRKITIGIDGRTLVWMWKRLLGILSWVHHFKIVHGAILPPHVMYFPDGSIRDDRMHAVRLVDWCYSINYEKERRLKAWIPDYKEFYPPEVINKISVKPSTDLYMGAMTMIYLTGGDVTRKKFNSRIPPQIANSIKKCLEPNELKRPQNVADIFDAFKATAADVYGKRVFHEFKLAL